MKIKVRINRPATTGNTIKCNCTMSSTGPVPSKVQEAIHERTADILELMAIAWPTEAAAVDLLLVAEEIGGKVDIDLLSVQVVRATEQEKTSASAEAAAVRPIKTEPNLWEGFGRN